MPSLAARPSPPPLMVRSSVLARDSGLASLAMKEGRFKLGREHGIYQGIKELIKDLILTLLCDFWIIALNGCFLISYMEQYMHFLPLVAYMGSNEFISLKIFCNGKVLHKHTLHLAEIVEFSL